VKHLKILSLVFLAFLSALIFIPVAHAYAFNRPSSIPVGSPIPVPSSMWVPGSDVEVDLACADRAPEGNRDAISPSPAMTLATQDFRASPQVSDASSDVSGTPGASSLVTQDGGKSRAKALALSTLLPGAGQYYAGRKGRATFFFLTESAIWTTFVVFEVQGYLRKNNYIDYAELMASVDAEGKPDDFYRALGRYMQSDPGPGSYNEDVRREARALYPDDKQKQDQYLQENGYFGKNAWQWQSEEDQAYYRSLRKKSQRSFNRATYMLGVAVANRILSAMDAARSTASSPKPAKASQGFRFEMRNNPDSPEHVMVCLTRSF